MNILFITDNFYPEGNPIASRVYERACYWVKAGHHVTVITSAPNFPEGKLYPGYKNKWFQRECIHGIDVLRVKTLIVANKGFFLRVLDFLSFMLPAFIVGLFQKKFDVIMASSPQFFGAITACLLAKCKRLPFMLELGDIWPASIVGVGVMRESLTIRLLEKLELTLYQHTDHIITISPAFKDNLAARGVPLSKMTTILNGVDLARYAPQTRNIELLKQYAIPKDAFIIGYVGTHGLAHALTNVLQAASLLIEHQAIHIVFVGTGAEREQLLHQAQGLKNVHFIPPQSKENIQAFWALSDVALVHLKNSPVFAEVIPSKIFEAMAMGLPILLSSPEGTASRLILDAQVGLWVPAENPEALVAAILMLWKNPNQRLRWKNTSLMVAPSHSRENQAVVTLLALTQLISDYRQQNRKTH